MQLFPENVKNSLFGLIHNMSAHAWLYSSDLKRDFTRKRKLPFEKILALLVSMGGHTMRDELLDHFGCDPEMASVPAFVQQRAKIMHEALEFLFHEFTNSCFEPILYKGYRLLAVDGSDLFPRNVRTKALQSAPPECALRSPIPHLPGCRNSETAQC